MNRRDSRRAGAMTPDHGPIDPRIASAIKELFAKGLIDQDGERPDGNGVMRPAYRIADGVDRSKLPAILDAHDERKNDPSTN